MRRTSATLRAAFTALGFVALLTVSGCASDTTSLHFAGLHETAPTTIAPLPEQQTVEPNGQLANDVLDRCIASGECQQVDERIFSNAQIEIYQQDGELPAVHVRTTYADAVSTVWSLDDDHSASYLSMTCSLANCLLNVAVNTETTATIDMRMISQSLTGKIDGAAVESADSTSAVDLDNDGELDLIAAQHIVQSDGTTVRFYRTFANHNRVLVETGCTLPSANPTPPTTLESRRCPA